MASARGYLRDRRYHYDAACAAGLHAANSSPHRVVLAAKRDSFKISSLTCKPLRSQRAMAAVLGAILRLPPIKRSLAQQQMKSHYLAALIERLQP